MVNVISVCQEVLSKLAVTIPQLWEAFFTITLSDLLQLGETANQLPPVFDVVANSPLYVMILTAGLPIVIYWTLIKWLF